MNSRIIFVALAGSLSIATYAQTTETNKNDNDEARLKKEITVERRIVPQLREAHRMSLAPAIEMPAVSPAKLDYSSRTISTRVPALFSPLSPAAYADSIALSPWRGYLTLGYFPTLDQLLSAGYRIIDRERTQLGAWIQYDASFFHSEVPTNYIDTEINKILFRRNTFAGGLNMSQTIGQSSAINIELGYGYDRYNVPRNSASSAFDRAITNTGRQHIIRFDSKATFSSTVNDLRYSIAANYNIFAFGNGISESADKQHIFGFEGLLRTNPEDESQAMLGLTFSGIHDSNKPDRNSNIYGVLLNESYTQALATLTPSYRYESGTFAADLGVRLDLTIHSGKAFHIAPNVKVNWQPKPTFTLWAKAGGGEVQNTLSSLYSFTYRLSPVSCYLNSHVPVTLDAGLTVGPFSGAYFRMFGGWAKANEWLMPIAFYNIYGAYGTGVAMSPVDIDGWHAGIAAGYSYRRIVDVEVSAEMAPQDYDKGYYLWRDRAKRVITATLAIRPVKELEIEAEWQYRGGRKIYDRNPVTYNPGWCGTTGAYEVTKYSADYSTLSSISIGGRWSFSPKASVFLNLNNLLNRKDITLLGEPGRGIYGLAGFSLNF